MKIRLLTNYNGNFAGSEFEQLSESAAKELINLGIAESVSEAEAEPEPENKAVKPKYRKKAAK